jgi:predicted alpha/beta hydrolase family esterase
MAPLPFPAKLIGSSTDPYCSVERAQALGAAWGADVSIIARAGHIDAASGHGPWPEGLLTFGLFLKTLS